MRADIFNTNRPRRFAALLALSVLVLFSAHLATPRSAHAAPLPQFWTTCTTGSSAGQCVSPSGLAVDPSTPGHVFVGDLGAGRINEFTVWGEFVRAWGYDVAPDGAPGDTPSDQFEICTESCQQGLPGVEPGLPAAPQGLAVDSAGDVYTAESSCCGGGYRVQKFDLSGADPSFEWMIGTGVEQGPLNPGDRCTAADLAAGDSCGAGSTGAGPSQFDWEGAEVGDRVAIDRKGTAAPEDDVVYVGERDRIQAFDIDGNYQTEIPFTGAPAPEAGRVLALAVDQASGDLYFAYSSGITQGVADQPDVHRVDPATGEVVDTLDVPIPRAVATAPDGGVYVFDRQASFVPTLPGNHINRVAKFDASGGFVEYAVENSAPDDSDQVSDNVPGLAVGSACFGGTDHALYAANRNAGSFADHDAFVRAFGPAPDDVIGCPRPERPPAIIDQYALHADTATATVGAKIDPRFWDDTTYYLQYATKDCIDADGWGGACVEEKPAAPGAPLDAGVVTGEIETADIALTGLAPGTAYRFRFVADSGGGGPVIGVGGTESAEGEAAGFRTFALSEPVETDCPNAALRSGRSALLPDCRAYEQASPVAKSGYDVVPKPAIAAPGGEAILFSSPGAFAGSPAGAFPAGYAAARTANGWQTNPLSPPIDPVSALYTGSVYGASADTTRQLVATSAKLTPEADAGDFNLYIHDSATDSYQFIDEIPGLDDPSGGETEYYRAASLVGAAADGSSFFFTVAGNRLLDSSPAPPLGAARNLYEFSDGGLKLVGVLPNGNVSPSGSQAAAGTTTTGPASRAVSEQGNRVYWTPSSGSSILYLREGGQTTLVSKRSSDDSAQPASFAHASADGSLALLTSSARLTDDASPLGSDLYRYDAEAEELTDLTPTSSSADVLKVLGTSEDGTYAYFIANGALAPGASPGDCNNNGTSGACNLYAWHEGETRLVARIATEAQFLLQLGEYNQQRDWRVSANGRYLTFLFGGEITGPASFPPQRHNPASREPYAQAYLYDYGAEELACASCPPADADMPADVSFQGLRLGGNSRVAEQQQEGVSRNVTDTGELFFQSSSRLVRRDANGVGACPEVKIGYKDTNNQEESDPRACQDVYSYRDGRVRLISSAGEEGPAFFGDASTDGSDVFIVSRERLVGQDGDSNYDLYDARIEGGLAAQNEDSVEPCSGDDCQDEGDDPPAGEDPRSDGVGEGNPALEEPDLSRCSKLKARSEQATKRAKKLNKKAKKTKQKAKRASGKRANKPNKKAKRQKQRAKQSKKKAGKLDKRADACRKEARS